MLVQSKISWIPSSLRIYHIGHKKKKGSELIAIGVPCGKKVRGNLTSFWATEFWKAVFPKILTIAALKPNKALRMSSGKASRPVFNVTGFSSLPAINKSENQDHVCWQSFLFCFVVVFQTNKQTNKHKNKLTNNSTKEPQFNQPPC